MNNNLQIKRSHLAVVAGTLLVVACGGGGGGGGGDAVVTDPNVAGTAVPTSATTSSAGAFTFVNGVAASSDNTAEPLVVGDAVLASSETDEPDASI